MADIGLGLSYWLPRTEFGVEATLRTSVATDMPGASRLATTRDVVLSVTTVEDQNERKTLGIDAGLLEKIDLTVSLDDRGFIQSVNSESSRDVSPIISLLGKAVTLAAAILVDLPDETQTTLEENWAAAHPLLNSSLIALIAKSEALLTRVADPTLEPGATVEAAAALDVVQTQLGLISQMRRSWIAAQASVVGMVSRRFSPAALHLVEEPDLPESLPAGTTFANPQMAEMAATFGVSLAIVDPMREPPQDEEADDLVDLLALRRSRPVAVGVYLRGVDRAWSLEPASVRRLDVVDEYSTTDYLRLDGSWLRAKTFELTYHPDMSLKSFGFGSTSSVSAIATSTEGAVDAIVAAKASMESRKTDDQRALESAKTQLELLQAANDFEVLSATRTRAAELALLEQQRKFNAP